MVVYKVQKGDTLGKIAVRFYGDAGRYPLIVAANRISNPDRLAVGADLIIPDAAVAASGLSGTATSPPPTSANTRLQSISEQRLGQLHPIVAVRARSMLDLCAHAGLALLVTQGLRTWAEQDALYAKGRTIPPKGAIVTKARGGQSFHNFGLAFDIVVLDAVGKADWDTSHPGWAKAAQIGKSAGLEWGGDWKSFKDLPHFQYTGDLPLARCRELHASGLAAVWEQVA
jgi:hypothetical protein